MKTKLPHLAVISSVFLIALLVWADTNVPGSKSAPPVPDGNLAQVQEHPQNMRRNRKTTRNRNGMKKTIATRNKGLDQKRRVTSPSQE